MASEADNKKPRRTTRKASSSRASGSKASSSSSRKSTAAKSEAAAAQPAANMPRLLGVYRNEHVPVLQREFGYSNVMQVPRMEKIVVNIGLGEALTSSAAVGNAMGDLEKITGQKPIEQKSRKSIANFKLREGQTIGTSVTLRSHRMWQFFDRLVNIALPRVRDFRGVSRSSFDGRGNYSLGMREQVVFPEIDYNEIDRLRGLQITIVTSARTDEEGRRLLELLGVPFVRADEQVARTA